MEEDKKVEVFKVLPAYHKVSKERKKNVLLLLIKWAEKELKTLNKK